MLADGSIPALLWPGFFGELHPQFGSPMGHNPPASAVGVPVSLQHIVLV